MSETINTIDLKNLSLLNRTVDSVNEVQSIRVNSFTGNFLSCFPIAEDDNTGNIILYPQNPNNSSYTSKTLKEIETYGNLDFPLDACWNPFTKRIWIADSGNNKIVAVNESDYSFIKSINNFTLPHSIVLNSNNRTLFVKSFSDKSTQKISQVNTNGDILFDLNVPGEISSVVISYTSSYLSEMPKYFTMDFDAYRNRLWFCSKAVLYMVDLDTKQIIENDLSTVRLNRLSCVSIDRESGNAFVIIDDGTNYYIQQIYKDNNKSFGISYLPEQPVP
jgi:DNA-binding beta-propeller fold protein YncE